MKYEIECPYCGNKQIYQPKKKIPKFPHTVCSRCKKHFNFKIVSEEQKIIDSTIKQSKKKKTILSIDKEELTPEYLERLILDTLENNPSPNMVRTATEFFIKVKLNKHEEIEQIDMSKFYKIGEKLSNKNSGS